MGINWINIVILNIATIGLPYTFVFSSWHTGWINCVRFEFAFELFACSWIQSNCVFKRGATGWIHYSLFWICFRVNLAVVVYNLIDCVFEWPSSSAQTFSVYFRGIEGIDILSTCVLCLYLQVYCSTFHMCLRWNEKRAIWKFNSFHSYQTTKKKFTKLKCKRYYFFLYVCIAYSNMNICWLLNISIFSFFFFCR